MLFQSQIVMTPKNVNDNNSKMPNFLRNDYKKIGGRLLFSAVFLQVYIAHDFASNHTKGEPWNFLMKAAALRF